MEQWEEAQKASTTATDSAGSAYRENEKYLESYEARLNRMQNAWTKAVLAMRDSALGDGIVVVTGLIEGLSGSITWLVEKFGLLPSVFGVASVGLLAFGDSFRGLVLESGKRFSALVSQVRMESSLLSSSMNQATVSSKALNTALATKTATVNLLSLSLKGLKTAFMTTILPMAASVAIFAAIGWGISKLIEKISKAKQEAEEIKRETDKLNKSFEDNENKIKSLAEEYETLSKKASSGEISENDIRYLKVQQELHELLPSLTDRIDEKGQAHLKSSKAVQEEIKSLEELNRLEATKFVKDFSEHVNEISKKVKELQKDIEKIDDEKIFLTEKPPAYRRIAGGTYENPNKEEDQIKKILLMREEQAHIEDLKQSYVKLAQAYSTQLGHKDALTKADKEYILTLVENNREQLNTKEGTEKLGETVKDTANKIALIRSAVGDLYTAEEINLIDDKQLALFDFLSNALKKGETDWESFRARIEKTTGSSEEADRVIKALTESQKENKDVVTGLVPKYDDLGNVVNYTEENMENLKDAHESVVESFNNSISAIESLNSVLNELQEGEGLSAKSIGFLLDKYPQLLIHLDDEVALRQAIQKEIVKQESLALDAIEKQLETNNKFFTIFKKGNSDLFKFLAKLYGEDLKNSANLAEMKAKINNSLIEKLGDVWSEYYDAERMAFTQAGKAKLKTMSYQAAINSPELKAIADYELAMKRLSKSLRSFTSKSFSLNLSSSNLSKSTSKASKSTSGLSKEFEHSTYVSDKFRQALEKLNLELEKQNAIQAKFPEHSKKYRNSLSKELGLLKQKKKLLEEQAKSLDKQIRSGKIQQTGIITTSSKGRYSGKYQSEINKASSTYGVDPNLIAAIIRAESNFNPRARSHAGAMGLMQLMPATARGLGVKNAYNPYQNIMGGTKYIAQQLKAFGGSIEKALAAYNAGPGNVRKYGGIPPFKETQAYVPRVLKYYSEYGGGKTSSASKQLAQNRQNIDQAKSDLLSLQKDVLATQADIDRLNYEIVESKIAYYENLIAGVDRSISKTQHQSKIELSTSEAYRKKLEEEVKHLKYKQSLLHKQANYIREELKSDKLSAAYKDELKAKVSELGLAWWDVAEAIRDVNFAILESRVQHYTTHLEGVDRTLQKISLMLSVMEEGTGEYTNMLSSQVKHYKYKHSLLHKEIAYLERQLKIGGYSKDQIAEINKILSDKKLQWWEVENAIKDVNKALEQQKDIVSDDVVNALKDAYAKRRDIIIKGIDEEIRELEKAHELKMKMYDEDLARYEELVRRKLELIDDEASEEDFQRELSKLRKEEARLQKEINKLSIDDSYWAKAEKTRLEEDLAKQKEEINRLQTTRERELRKKNLSEQLEDYRKDTERKKETEDKKYEAERERLESIKKETEYTYNEILANERKWAKMREDVIDGNISNIKTSIDEFLEYFVTINENAAKKIGESYQEILNIIDRLNKGASNIQDSVESEGAYFKQTVERMKANADKYARANRDERIQLKQENQRLGESVGAVYEDETGTWSKNGQRLYYVNYEIPIIEKMKKNSAKWQDASPSERKKLEEENKRLGKSIKATYNSSTGRWFKGGVPLYHDGGVIGNKGSKLAKILNSLANLKSNEQIVKGLKGEVMIPEKNIPNLFGNISKLIVPPVTKPQGSVGTGDTNIIFEVDKMYANETEVVDFSKKIINSLKRNKGGRY